MEFSDHRSSPQNTHPYVGEENSGATRKFVQNYLLFTCISNLILAIHMQIMNGLKEPLSGKKSSSSPCAAGVLLARHSQQAPRSVMVPVLLWVGIIRVHFLYLNPKICKYQIFSTDILSPVEKGMHTNGFRWYKKCTHLTIGTGNVYLNPG